jgi:hypothetical protein
MAEYLDFSENTAMMNCYKYNSRSGNKYAG